MIIELILVFLGLIGLIIAVYSDFKTTEIPDWLSYSLIITAISLRAFNSLAYNNLLYIKIAVINLIIFFIIGNIMFYSKQWGGGDVKLLMALSVIFATYPEFLLKFFSPILDINFPLIIFINTLMVGCIYSMILTIYKSIKNRKEFLKQFKTYLVKTSSLRKIVLILSILLIILSIIITNIYLKIIIFFSSLSILFLLYSWIYLKSVEKSCMYKVMKLNELREGDWITKDIYKNKNLILKIPRYGITKQEINLLKKYKINEVEIKQGIIFTPSFLIATILSLIFGDLLAYII